MAGNQILLCSQWRLTLDILDWSAASLQFLGHPVHGLVGSLAAVSRASSAWFHSIASRRKGNNDVTNRERRQHKRGIRASTVTEPRAYEQVAEARLEKLEVESDLG
jgi:hypothetical protein